MCLQALQPWNSNIESQPLRLVEGVGRVSLVKNKANIPDFFKPPQSHKKL